jgi:membrane protease YdiL (CAAX protease family)
MQSGLRSARALTYFRLTFFWVVFAGLLIGTGPIVAVFHNRWATGAAFGAIVSSGIVLLILWYSRKGWTQLSACGIGIDGGTPLRLGVGAVLGLLLLAPVLMVLATVEGVYWVRTPQVNPVTIGAALVSYLLLACMEEVGFRSYPLLGLKRVLGLWTAQSIVAVAFIAYHVLNGQAWVSAVVGTGLGSLLFGMAAVASRGLALPIGLHAMWNFGSWALGDKGGPGVWTPVFPHSRGRSGEFAYVAAFLLWTVGFLFWQKCVMKARFD